MWSPGQASDIMFYKYRDPVIHFTWTGIEYEWVLKVKRKLHNCHWYWYDDCGVFVRFWIIIYCIVYVDKI
jgi:hypothetical protein